MGTTSLIKILETPCIAIQELSVKTRLVNLSFEIFTTSFQEKDENGQPKYANCFFRYHGVNGYSIKFMVWIAGDRTVLKNFMVEKSAKIGKKKWFEFWKKDRLEKVIASLILSEKDATQIILDSLTENIVKNLLGFCERV